MKGKSFAIQEIDMISAYPDTTVPIKSTQMIGTLTEMANEDF